MMRYHIPTVLITVLIIIVLCGVFILNIVSYSAPALADIQTIEEAPGQILYQSRHTLQDQHGDRWQIIAFNRLRPDGRTSFYLRLVSFPGVAEINRSKSITLTTSLGQSLVAADASSKIFTDESTPEPNVGQYDLQPIVSQLSEVVPLQITLPLLNKSDSLLPISPAMIQKWKTITAHN
ncbi:MAG: DUF3122 domain-containing protein [Cyanobacteria bacterium P01_E01_bin.6]